MLYDQHMHSHFSQDGHCSIFTLAQAALDRGLTGITITDHFDLCHTEIGYAFYLEHESARREEFERAREAFSGQLEIYWGLEIGNPYFMPDTLAHFLSDRTFDFILGSVHFLQDGSDIYLIDYTQPDAAHRVLSAYFQDILLLLQYNCFDSLAHLDYPLRVMKSCIPDASVLPYRDLIDPILQSVVQRGLALEINTRGLMDWKKRQEPEDWVLARYHALGGRRITIGSDAHVSDAVGVGIAQASQTARHLGFTHMTVYRNRCPHAVPLPSHPDLI